LGEICEQEIPPWQKTASRGDHSIRCHISIEELKRMYKDKELIRLDHNEHLENEPQIVHANSNVSISSPEADDR
jgi:hypothetical protein